jgi:flagellar biosynthesis/type III secretory pathway protein FliH
MAYNDDILEITAEESLCLEIDIELRDVWVYLDEMREIWDEPQLTVAACAMRVAFDRGRRQGETAGKADGYDEGYEDGHEQGYAEGYDMALAAAPG